MKVKKDLAWSIVRDFHSAEAADAAAESWAKQFQQRAVTDDAPVVEVSSAEDGLLDAEGAIRLPRLLVLAGLASSAGEATRKLGENAVSVNGAKCAARSIARTELGDAPVLRLGKKSVRVEWLP